MHPLQKKKKKKKTQKPTHRHTIFKIQKIKDEEKFLKEIWDGGNILLIEKQR